MAFERGLEFSYWHPYWTAQMVCNSRESDAFFWNPWVTPYTGACTQTHAHMCTQITSDIRMFVLQRLAFQWEGGLQRRSTPLETHSAHVYVEGSRQYKSCSPAPRISELDPRVFISLAHRFCLGCSFRNVSELASL